MYFRTYFFAAGEERKVVACLVVQLVGGQEMLEAERQAGREIRAAYYSSNSSKVRDGLRLKSMVRWRMRIVNRVFCFESWEVLRRVSRMASTTEEYPEDGKIKKDKNEKERYEHERLIDSSSIDSIGQQLDHFTILGNQGILRADMLCAGSVAREVQYRLGVWTVSIDQRFR